MRRPLSTTIEILLNEPTSSIGGVAIAPTDANLVWVGTGENNNRQSSSWGDGVHKSVDGGKSWKNMGLRDSKHIARIIVDPVDSDVVYVAALATRGIRLDIVDIRASSKASESALSQQCRDVAFHPSHYLAQRRRLHVHLT